MSEPSFSIVICTNGRRVGLTHTLRSLEYLDYPSFEVCVVSGPTEDGTKEFLDSFGDQIKVEHCPERNLSMSRNLGIGLAAGEIVAFIDDDAMPEAEWLRDLAAGYIDDTVAGTGGIVYDHTGWDFQYLYATADRLGNADWNRKTPADEYNFPLSDRFPYLQGTNASFRRSALLEIGGFDEEIEFYLDETDVCCRLVDAGYRIVQLPNAPVHHKFLPSHIRNVHRVTKNLYPVIKNKIYFSLVNNHGHHRMNDVLEDARRFISHHAADVEHHAQGGRLTGDDVVAFRDHVDNAWERGLRAGLTGERLLLSRVRAEALQRPYTEFPRPIPDSGRKTFCFLSREYPPGRIGGIGTYTQNVAASLANAGHHVHVLTQSDDLNTVDFEDGVWVHRLAVKCVPQETDVAVRVPQHIWNYSATLREELHKIDARRPISAVEAPIWDVEGIAPLMDGTIPTALSLHTSLGIWLETHDAQKADPTYMRMFAQPVLAAEKHLLETSEAIHANSQAIIDRLSAVYDVAIDDPRTRVIHHGISDPTMLPRTTHRRLTRDLHILFVGRLEQRKGIDLLLAAVPSLLTRYRGLTWDIVGDDTVPWSGESTFREEFAKWPTTRGCGPHVRFHGKVSQEDVRGFFAQADIVVVPSRFESFGLTVIEAFAYGKPVVAASSGGIVEIVRHEETGLLVASDDSAGLGRALERLIADPDLRLKLGQAGRTEYERRFTDTRMADELADFLAGIERQIVPESELVMIGKPKIGVSLWADRTGIMLNEGDAIELPAGRGTVYLTFWRHTWSGLVQITTGGRTLAEWDLYSSEPWLATLRIDGIDSDAPVLIERTERRNVLAEGAEVIFFRAAWHSGPPAAIGDSWNAQ